VSYLEDPRVLFAAERTLLAWVRTAITLMGFGFVVAKFGLYLHLIAGHQPSPVQEAAALVIGIALVGFGVATSIMSALQYQRIIRTLGPAEIPPRYQTGIASLSAWALAAAGVLLALYLGFS